MPEVKEDKTVEDTATATSIEATSQKEPVNVDEVDFENSNCSLCRVFGAADGPCLQEFKEFYKFTAQKLGEEEELEEGQEPPPLPEEQVKAFVVFTECLQRGSNAAYYSARAEALGMNETEHESEQQPEQEQEQQEQEQQQTEPQH